MAADHSLSHPAQWPLVGKGDIYRGLRGSGCGINAAPQERVFIRREKRYLLEPFGCFRRTGATVKFLSLEPLLGPLPGLNLEGIDWVIVGGESGPGARPMDPAWVTEIRDQCQEARVPFFFKQWGGTRKKKAGRKLEGRTWDEMPAAAFALSL